MFSNITRSLVDMLCESGIRAGRAYPTESIVRDGECFVRVRIELLRQSGAGFGGFIGIETDENGNRRELYGMRCEMEMALDIYAGDAEKCEGAVDEIILALGQSNGLDIREVKCSGVGLDRDTGLLLCPCRAGGELFLTLETENEEAQFSDFILKGEIR